MQERCIAVRADVTITGNTLAALSARECRTRRRRGEQPAVRAGRHGYCPEVDWDPHGRVRGDDGMSVITPMLEVVGRLLRPGGRAGIEHDETTSAKVIAAARATGVFTEINGYDDLTGRPRFVTMERAATDVGVS